MNGSPPISTIKITIRLYGKYKTQIIVDYEIKTSVVGFPYPVFIMLTGTGYTFEFSTTIGTFIFCPEIVMLYFLVEFRNFDFCRDFCVKVIFERTCLSVCPYVCTVCKVSLYTPYNKHITK